MTPATAERVSLRDQVLAALHAGHIRGHADLLPRNAPADWAVPVRADETVLESMQIDDSEIPGPLRSVWRGMVTLVIRNGALPSVAAMDADARERVATILAEELLKEVP